MIPRSLDSFDFLKQHLVGGDEQAINPATDVQREFMRFQPVFNGQLGQVTRRS